MIHPSCSTRRVSLFCSTSFGKKTPFGNVQSNNPSAYCRTLDKEAVGVHHCSLFAPCVFVATMKCCTSQLKICNPNTSSTFCWSWGKMLDLKVWKYLLFSIYRRILEFNFTWSTSPSHLIASAHRELPVIGSSQDVAQVGLNVTSCSIAWSVNTHNVI